MNSNPNPLDPTAQKDYSKEWNQLKPRSLSSNGVELDESCGEITSSSLPGSINLDEVVKRGAVTRDESPLPLMTREGKTLAERSAPQNALEDLTPTYNKR